MKQNIHATATALAFFKQKAEGFFRLKAESKRLKAVCKSSQKQLTEGLPQPASHNADASGFAMTGEGEAVLLKERIANSKAITQSHATGSGGLVKRRAGSLASRAEGSFYLAFLNTFLAKQKVLSPRGDEREDFQSKKSNLNIEYFTTPFNSPASGVHWAQTYRVGMGTMILKWFSRQLEQLLLTQRPFDFSFDSSFDTSFDTSFDFAQDDNAQDDNAQDDSSQGDLGVRKEVRIKKVYQYKKYQRLRPNLLMLLLTLVVIIGTGNKTKAQTKALQIGDSIPEALWNMPLKAIQHPKGKSTFDLKDYKDKLIILDFWATWCAPCIKSLGKLANLQEEFPADLAVVPITYQDEKTADTFLKSKDNWLLSVVGETRLKAWFPYLSIPHQVWIKDGKVLAIPAIEYTTAENIGKELLGAAVKMVMKENIPLDTQSPLFIKGNGGDGAQTLYQSVLSGRINLYTGGGGPQNNKDGNKLLYINLTLDHLLMQALGKSINNDMRRVIWETDSATRFKITGKNLKQPIGDYGKDSLYNSWMYSNTYCYNLFAQFPMHINEAYQTMAKELNLFAAFRFGIKASLEKRKVACLVLHVNGDTTALRTMGGDFLASYHDPKGYQARNVPAGNAFGRMLSNVMPNKLLIDASGITRPITLSLNRNIDSNLLQANKALKPYGLILKEEELFLDMMVIKKLGDK